jgi:tetratricopeptide (TPR) repeat protein
MRNRNLTFGLIMGSLGMASAHVHAIPSINLSKAMTAYHERHWQDAMGNLLDVLVRDPQNVQAHTYINLMTKELQSRLHSEVQEERMNLLAQVSKRLEIGRMDPKVVDSAILETTQAEKRTREERWRTRCEEADVEMHLGHLIAANDLILRVIAEDPRHTAAQQLLSDLQIQLHDVLDHGPTESVEERYALEGFFAYGQSDYEAAAKAWAKVLTLLQQTYNPTDRQRHLAALRFYPYQQIAKAHVEDNRRSAQIHQQFDQAIRFYQEGHYGEALEMFRKIAVIDPEYPQLGEYLARAESADEKERAHRLGEEKRQEIVRWVELGTKALEQARYTDAEKYFQNALGLDGSNSRARSYLAMVQAEIQRRHDPKAAQQHYEAGLIAYASGKLEEAIREWTIVTRMNPQHEKAVNALSKVQKELALNTEKELP